jgi:hypothetical protein
MGQQAGPAPELGTADQPRPTLNDRLFQALAPAVAPLRRLPAWAQASVIYLAARFVSYCIFLAVALHQGASPWGPAHPAYLQFIEIWDSQWYQRIFDSGYPSVLPLTASGTVDSNNWAFYPLFPFLVKGISIVTGLGWTVLAPIVALLAGWGAALVILKLFRQFASAGTALWGVAFFATFPTSAILQVPYAESLSTLLLAASLYLLVRRRYLTALPVVVFMCFSRPAGVPFVAVVVLHLVLRWWHRDREPFPHGERVAGVALTLVSAAAAFAWPAIAWLVTGDRNAYTDTEMAWRGGGSLQLFKPWFSAADDLVGRFWGPLLPVLLLALAFLYLNSRAVRKIGTDLRLWCALYFLYLFAVLYPQTSTFRMLLPLFPLALATAFVSKSRAYRWTVVVMFVLLQIVWVTWLWRWTELPGGGDYPP